MLALRDLILLARGDATRLSVGVAFLLGTPALLSNDHVLLVLILDYERQNTRMLQVVRTGRVAALCIFRSNFEMSKRLLLATVAVIDLTLIVTIELKVVTQLNYLSALFVDTVVTPILLTAVAIATLLASVFRSVLLLLLVLRALTTVDLLTLLLFIAFGALGRRTEHLRHHVVAG